MKQRHAIPRGAAAALVLLFGVTAAPAAPLTTVTVPGWADPWLAGMPDGATASLGDIAPDQSPVLVTGFGPGDLLSFEVTGGVTYIPGCDPATMTGCYPPDGDLGWIVGHATGAENGIANVVAPISALVGVFLDDAAPDGTAAPAGLDFNPYSPTAIGIDFTSLTPALKQVFFIGDGLTGAGEVQTFEVPTGATRLFLGVMDGYGWYNNSGEFTVTVSIASPEPPSGPTPVPEPLSLVLTGAGLLGMGWHRGRLRRRG